MKELSVKQTISYRWWRTDKKSIRKEHIEALKETAMNRISDLMKDGYASGELIDNIRIDDRDGEDGIEYQGWFEIKEEQMKELFLNHIDDIGWLLSTHLKGQNPPVFNSFIISGNEDCPDKVELFKKLMPHYRNKPIATYKANENGDLEKA